MTQFRPTVIEWLTNELWPQGAKPDSPKVYALLDGARDPRIEPLVRKSQADFSCLYAGRLSRDLSAAAPYLLHLKPDQPYTRQLLQESWGQSWGCFAVAPSQITLEELRKHFRTLLRVTDPHGNTLVFRFYDPRVLRVFLPTCPPQERIALFGPTSRLVAETGTEQSLISYFADPADGVRAHLSIWPSSS